MKKILEGLKTKFQFIEERNGEIIFKIFYKNGNLKNWYSISNVENGKFRLTRGGIQLVDGNEEFILIQCLGFIN
jgi:hypothetical protein